MGSRKGFTIIEILVVVSIIVILVSVVIAVGSSVKAAGQRSGTKVTLKALKAVYDSYVQETGQVDTTNGNVPAFLPVASNMPQLAKAINAFPPTVLIGNVAYDGFGGRIFIANSPSRGTYFESAGPDGTFGTSDDMFSYDP